METHARRAREREQSWQPVEDHEKEKQPEETGHPQENRIRAVFGFEQRGDAAFGIFHGGLRERIVRRETEAAQQRAELLTIGGPAGEESRCFRQDEEQGRGVEQWHRAAHEKQRAPAMLDQ